MVGFRSGSARRAAYTRLVRRAVFGTWILAVAAGVLITAVMSASASPGGSFSGATSHRAYTLFLQTQCSDGCAGGAGTVLVLITAGRPGVETGSCPYGTNELVKARLAGGRFSTNGWFFI